MFSNLSFIKNKIRNRLGIGVTNGTNFLQHIEW